MRKPAGPKASPPGPPKLEAVPSVADVKKPRVAAAVRLIVIGLPNPVAGLTATRPVSARRGWGSRAWKKSAACQRMAARFGAMLERSPPAPPKCVNIPASLCSCSPGWPWPWCWRCGARSPRIPFCGGCLWRRPPWRWWQSWRGASWCPCWAWSWHRWRADKWPVSWRIESLMPATPGPRGRTHRPPSHHPGSPGSGRAGRHRPEPASGPPGRP